MGLCLYRWWLGHGVGLSQTGSHRLAQLVGQLRILNSTILALKSSLRDITFGQIELPNNSNN